MEDRKQAKEKHTYWLLYTMVRTYY